ncbi:MAG: alcohol-forming fatty acyl-CoA reductase, partial [Actinomycetota bacterium]|nr:alcohol-forming fatty acyl-CoA reductase [Actinomycetota bacterium]
MSPKKAAKTDSVFAHVGLGKSHVFLTGGTGFLGQAILERLLSDHPET